VKFKEGIRSDKLRQEGNNLRCYGQVDSKVDVEIPVYGVPACKAVQVITIRPIVTDIREVQQRADC
jgi:hypothetical protein